MLKYGMGGQRTITAPQSNSAPSKDTWALLAGMRFLLATGVVAYHLSILEDAHDPITNALWRYGAYCAVPLFFIVSGYSIAASLDREPNGYFERRIRRIYPVYLVAVIAACVPWDWISQSVINTAAGPQFAAPAIFDFATTLTLTQALWGKVTDSAGPLWSVGVEWAFYMLAPWLMRVRSRYLLPAIALSTGAFWLASIADHTARTLTVSGHTMLAAGILDFAWLWLLGFLVYRHRKSIFHRASLLIPALFILTVAPYNVDHALPLCSLALGIIFLMPKPPTLPSSMQGVLNWLGDVSYPLYAVHYPVILWFDFFAHVHSPWILGFASLGAAIALYYGVDKPLRKPFKVKSRTQKPISEPSAT